MASRAREFENLEFVENNYAYEDQEMETNVDPANNNEDNNINKEDWLNNVYEYYPDGRIKRRRGPTKLAHLSNLPEGVRIIVKLDRFNAPISKSAGLLGSYLGTLVKKPHLAPLNVLKWNDDMFKEIYHDKLLAAVTKKFAIGPKSRDWLVNQLGNKWRQYKAKLKKKHYKAELPMERVMENAPETVEETQWNTLVSYWYSEEEKVMLFGSFQ
nr:uncharacterized protein LOC127315142 [Lolium perenne]